MARDAGSQEIEVSACGADGGQSAQRADRCACRSRAGSCGQGRQIELGRDHSPSSENIAQYLQKNLGPNNGRSLP